MSYEKFKAEFMYPYFDMSTVDKIKLELEKIGCTMVVVKKMSKRRSNLINNALHLWFTQCEAHCNREGHTADMLILKKGEDGVYREEMKSKYNLPDELVIRIFDEIFPALVSSELPITEVMLKDYFRQCGKYMFGKDSTSKLTNKEMCDVIAVCERIWSDRLGFIQEFPNRNLLEYGEKNKKIN